MTGLPSIGNNFIPSFFQLTAFLPSTTTPSLLGALADPAAWVRTELLIGFRGGPDPSFGSNFSFNGRSAPLTFVSKTVTPVQVPEAAPLSFVAVALLLLMLLKARNPHYRKL